MVIGVAPRHIDAREAFEVVADGQLVRHAHAAVQMHGQLSDRAARTSDDRFGCGDRFAPSDRISVLDAGCGEQRGRAGLLGGNRHLGDSMLQRLERADRTTELTSRLQVLGRDGKQLFHAAHSLGTQRRNAHIDRVFERLETRIDLAEHRIRTDRHIAQRHFGRSLAIDVRKARDGHTRCTCIHHKQSDAVTIAVSAARARRYDQERPRCRAWSTTLLRAVSR